MKFAKKIEQDLVTKKLKTTKYYICPICGYMTITSEFDGKIIREFGEEDFILFPFASLTTSNGATKEYCACPACDALQVIDGCEASELDVFVPKDQNGYVS